MDKSQHQLYGNEHPMEKVIECECHNQNLTQAEQSSVSNCRDAVNTIVKLVMEKQKR